MKKFLQIVIIFFIANKGQSQTIEIVGKWINTNTSNPVTKFEFKSNKNAIMYSGTSESPTFVYKIDYQKNPIWLDMTAEKDSIKISLLGLVEFIDENTIKLKLFRGMYLKHPEEFTADYERDNVYLLKREIK